MFSILRTLDFIPEAKKQAEKADEEEGRNCSRYILKQADKSGEAFM